MSLYRSLFDAIDDDDHDGMIQRIAGVGKERRFKLNLALILTL
jgi:hypothetical protein